MAASEIKDFISAATVAPDNNVTFDIRPHETMLEEGAAPIIINLGDDGSEERIDLGTPGDAIFYITLMYKNINESDAGTIMDMYYNSSKGDRGAKSIKWVNYGETLNTVYTVRFDSPLKRNIKRPLLYDISSIKLKILGLAP